MMTGQLFAALLAEAEQTFGPRDGWNHYEVGRWLKQRVDGLKAGQRDRGAQYATGAHETAPARTPKNFTEPDEVVVGRWDDCEGL
jgi:hypothetical protein